MIKSIVAVLLLFLSQALLLSQDPVSIKMTVPSVVGAGQEFRVSITIDKGELEEFSRLQQELPSGLVARQDNSGSADYSFDNQRVRFIWLKLPSESPILLNYKVLVNERLKGTFTLGGEFSYVENNERKSVNLRPESINITPSPSVSADKQIDIGSYTSVLATEQASTSSTSDVTCIRQTPYKARTGNDIMVNLLVYKRNMNKFAKIEERIPPGFKAVAVESREGLFTYKEGVAKFVWMNLPEDPGFTVSYRLIPEASKSIDDLQIRGTLSYILEGRNISVDIAQKDVYLSGISNANIEALMVSLESGEELPAGKPVQTEQVEIKPPPVKEQKPIVKEEKPVVKETRTTTTGSSGIPERQRLPVQDGIYYRVQLAATSRFSDANKAFAANNLSRPVLVERHNGLYKYTVGSFNTYDQANDFRNTVLSRGIRGAFVVAYRNGKRINVMDARKATGG
ncbi:MAG: SPOR domain-containing protein [Bacteroidales bacterium]|nr:SPOR domain-containing protein [Bacteroidales bacterium]